MTVFEVLAEPNRRLILDLLRQRDRAVGELVDEMRLPQPAVSKHLRVLRDHGLVTTRVDGPRRIYAVDAAPLQDVDRWLAPYRALWSDAIDRLEQHLDATTPVAGRSTRRTR